jgi:SAM-dependent methyltransferase
MSPESCPVCTSPNVEVSQPDPYDFEYAVKPKRRFQYLECGSCDSEFITPRPTTEELISFYPSDYHAYHDDHGGIAALLVGMRSKARARFYQRLTQGKKGRLFDIGTGDCRHFDALKPYCDLEFTGVEVKPEIVERARQRGYQVSQGTLETMDLRGLEGTCEIVSANHLIEHVLNPAEVVRRSFVLLKSGGYFIGQNPTNSCWERRIFGRHWAGYHFPRHLQAFSKEGFAEMLRKAGFVDVKVTTAPHLQSALSLQNFLVGRLGYRPRMKFGKTPIYSLLMLAVAPFEVLAYLCGHGGIIDFSARKP